MESNSECNKRGYVSKDTADIMLKRIKKISKRYKNWRKIKRSYQCSICGFWHLTSQGFKDNGNSKK